MLTACSDPSGHVQVEGGLQSPQGPFSPLPWGRPCLSVTCEKTDLTHQYIAALYFSEIIYLGN